jgi:4'-phosphopantetheinyl transferase
MASLDSYSTPITRFYLDIRPLIPSNKHDPTSLPLIDTLLQEQRAAIQKYLRPADRLMSLASALLKYTFIHRYALIPWNEVRISKTLKPHNRPYWQPTTDWTGQGGLEFNVTHQNGVVAIIGCKTPTPQDNHHISPITKGTNGYADGPLTSERSTNQIRLGVDLACTHEEGRTPKDVTSQAKLDEWVDIFGEMFSWRCRQDIKHGEIPNTDSATIYQKRLRRFYAYWGLKEAFIKMVGEGLLADWLRELEFEDVHAPEPASPEDFPDDGFSWALSDDEERKWSAPDRAVRDIKAKLEIEKDIRPCAEGRCQCLEQKIVSLSTTSVMTGEQEEYRIIQANGTKQEGFEVPYP